MKCKRIVICYVSSIISSELSGTSWSDRFASFSSFSELLMFASLVLKLLWLKLPGKSMLFVLLLFLLQSSSSLIEIPSEGECSLFGFSLDEVVAVSLNFRASYKVS